MTKSIRVVDTDDLDTKTERDIWANLDKTAQLHRKSVERVRRAHTELMSRCAASSDPDVREAYAQFRAAEQLEQVLGGKAEP